MSRVFLMPGYLKPRAATTNSGHFVTTILILLIVGINSVMAQQVPVTVILSPVKDNTIYQRNTSNSNGAGEFFIAGTTGSPYFNHALIKFDIAGGIPAGAVIQNASLTLHLAGTSGNSGPYNIDLHKLLQDWGEGTSNAGTQAGQGAPATTNDATWANTFFPSSLWTSGGGSYNAPASGAQLVNGTGFYTWSSAAMVNDLQDWMNNPAGNFGWLLKSNELASFQAKKFESRENPVVANRPSLTIMYTLNQTNQPPFVTITNPANNSVYLAGSAINLNVTATDSDGTITRVEFYNNGFKFAEDSTSPYGLTGNEVEPDNYFLSAKATDNKGATALSDIVKVTVTTCSGSGSIGAEGYTGIPGTILLNLSSDPHYPGNPDIIAALNKFEYGPNFADNYGGRLRGYICAPATGNYIFYIASDDQSELWLSTDDSPANIRRIAFVESRVGFRSWYTYPTQRSVSIRLVKGVRYYIETVHKEGTGSDHLSVGWIMPGGIFEAPIPGSRLSAWGSSSQSSRMSFGEALRTAQEPKREIIHGLTIKAAPNPSSNFFKLTIRSNSLETVNITVTDVLGRVVDKRTGIAANGTIQIGNNLNAGGLYFVEVQQGDKKQRLKLIKQ